MKRVIIIGGGASGLTCAINLKRKGYDVTILEKNKSLGKKILITGNGKCNFWNEDISINHYRTNNKEILEKMLENKDIVLPFFDSIGIVPRIKNGYYYPYSNVAVCVQNELNLEIKKLNIKTIYETSVTDVKKTNEFIINTTSGTYTCDKLVIACGASAAPKTGSDGFGFELLNRLGHHILKPVPALVQLKGCGSFLKEWAGIRSDVVLSLYENNSLKAKEEGEVLLTDYGISGIVTLNISGRVSRGLDNNKKEVVKIDFLPAFNNLKEFIDDQNRKVKNRTIIELLESMINYKLLYAILKKCNINSDKCWNDITDNDKNNIVSNLKEFKLEIVGTRSFNEAQVTSGGVLLTDINPDTFESKIIKDLYIIGELLDVDGDCGGFNLGFAWISGLSAIERCENNDKN